MTEDLAERLTTLAAWPRDYEDDTKALIDAAAAITGLRLALAEMTADRDRHRAMAEHLTPGKK